MSTKEIRDAVTESTKALAETAEPSNRIVQGNITAAKLLGHAAYSLLEAQQFIATARQFIEDTEGPKTILAQKIEQARDILAGFNLHDSDNPAAQTLIQNLLEAVDNTKSTAGKASGDTEAIMRQGDGLSEKVEDLMKLSAILGSRATSYGRVDIAIAGAAQAGETYIQEL